uniref:Uncharacterized protein n=1 Tax=Leersia perrieri TaxID=77586 RepID=A0A0D9V6H0_9ORYZ
MKFLVQLIITAIPISEGDYRKIKWQVTPSIPFYKDGWACPGLTVGPGKHDVGRWQQWQRHQ